MSFFLGSGRQRRPPPFGIEMLRAAKPPLRRGFACGKTLVQRKRAAGQMAGLKAAAPAFDLALGRIGIYRVAMFQSKRAPAQKEARTKIEYTVPDLQSRLELAQNQEPPLNKAGGRIICHRAEYGPRFFVFRAEKQVWYLCPVPPGPICTSRCSSTGNARTRDTICPHLEAKIKYGVYGRCRAPKGAGDHGPESRTW